VQSRHARLTIDETGQSKLPGFYEKRITKKGPPEEAALSLEEANSLQVSGIFDLGGDRVELVVQRIAEGASADHDGERDESGDQAVFDSGRTAVVTQKILHQVTHYQTLFSLLQPGHSTAHDLRIS
jgi:hypothetical protein